MKAHLVFRHILLDDQIRQILVLETQIHKLWCQYQEVPVSA